MTDWKSTAKEQGLPIIDGDQVTFISSEPAELVGDFNNWNNYGYGNYNLQPIAPDVWSQTITLPRDAYIEYAFVRDGKRSADPLNRRRVNDGMGHINSYFWMPDAVDTPLAKAKRSVPRGSVLSYDVDTMGYMMDASRTIHLYDPPVDSPVPLLVVFDGSGYLRKAKLANIVDNSIASGRIHPIAMALVDPGGRGRTVEYACSDTTTAFIIKCVLPLAQRYLNLIDVEAQPASYGLMGASMGGLMSIYIALRAPELFGHVLCESGAFGADHLYYRSVIYDLIRYGARPTAKVWMDVGLHEWFLEPNRAMHKLLLERGCDAEYREHNSGHNYPSWRNSLWRGLEHLYGRKA